MRIAAKDYIINTIYLTNILPVISRCNTSCIFCSHKQNPEAVEVFKMPELELEDFRELISYLSPERKIVIGESASRIIEGEPLLYKDFLPLLDIIRKKIKKTPVQITTNGTLLTEDLVDEIVKLGGVELKLSINSMDKSKRMHLLGLKKEDDIEGKIALIKNKLKFSASCVFDTRVLNLNDIREMAAYLDESGADTFSIYLQGCTSKADHFEDLKEQYIKTADFVKELRSMYSIPIIVEPAYIDNLECRIEGIIKGTAASGAGLTEGDVITHINGEEVISRVDGFSKAYMLARPELTIIRKEKTHKIVLDKNGNISPGFVVLYDIDPEILKKVGNVVNRYHAKKVLFATSQLAQETLSLLLKKAGFRFEYNVLGVRNCFFGGNIRCAGLLTIQDIIDCVEHYLESNQKPDLILIPPVLLDFMKRDLLGRNISELENRLGIPVDTT